ncbi:transglycosylase domain-containing protein [Alicyclobacillus mengziensis]|uniref:Penicillin-binding protein n=1 Tax=Alicyclobacillus mengziensis TaxID=2931921 RepID=A0A9X7Z6H4_9BACL|nr:transglycosylase domain-containing protein [Alicyclobacillus mengziensis]QSO46250.1 penicillin-binding protein [Alicyclobacillus mengziensis]
MADRSKPSSREQKRKEKADNKRAKTEARRGHVVLRIIGYTFLFIGGIIVVAIGAGIGYGTALLKGLPTVTAATFTNNSAPTVVYDKHGKIIGQFAADGDRQPISSIHQVSPNLVQAFVAAEDKTFYQNIGINPLAMARAFVQDLTHHQIQSGASTITQETVKLAVFPDQQRTLKRKVQEIALAIEVNRILSKDEIMTDYMNWLYMGRMGSQDVYGVKTASNILFHKDPKDLNLAEAAFLAAIPNNPSLFSPYQYPQNTVKRQHLILQHMLANGTITQAQYSSAASFNILKDIHQPAKTTQPYPYLMNDDVRPLVAKYLVSQGLYSTALQAEDALPTAGYKVYTTIDLNMQNDVNSVLQNNKLFGNTTKTVKINGKILKDSNGKPVQDLYEAGVTLVDNQTGGILAIGGGRDYYKDYYDHSDLPRQPGSSIKPLLDYGPAIQMGKLTAATPIMDGPITFPSGSGQPWKPTDDEPYWHGIVSARQALYQSLNVPAIKVLQYITPQAGGQYLEKMGITTSSKTINGLPTLAASDLQELPSAIGGLANGLTVQQMTSAYSTFPNQGVWRQSYLISHITDHQGNTVYQAHPKQTTVFSSQTAYVIDSMLRDVVTQPTGTAYAIGTSFPKNYYIYGKTGTTDQQRDGWFVGYTQKYTMGIWMGYNHHEQIEVYPVNWYSLKFTLWSKIMAPIFKESPPTTPIQEPPGIVQLAVCKDSGELPSTLCKQQGDVYNEIFVQGTEPTQTDNVHVAALYTVINGKKYLATTNTPANEVKQGTFIDPSKIQLNQPWPLPPGVVTSDSSQYVPTQPDPRGGTVLQAPSSTPSPTLSAPTNVQANVDPTGAVNLLWSPVNTATSYTVWRATSANGPYVNIAGPIPATAYTDKNLPSGASVVYYQIYAASDSAISPPSQPVAVQVGVPAQTGTGNGTDNNVGNTTAPATTTPPPPRHKARKSKSSSGSGTGGLPELLWPSLDERSRVN